MKQSEVARIREQIALEYSSAQLALHGFSNVATHEYITKRQENIASYFVELQHHMTDEEAIQLIRSISEP